MAQDEFTFVILLFLATGVGAPLGYLIALRIDPAFQRWRLQGG